MQQQQQQQQHQPTTVKFVPIDQQQKLHLAMVPVEAAGSSARKKKTLNMVIFIVDRSGSMGSLVGTVVMPACKGFLAEVRPDDAAIVFFNHGADVVPNVTVDRFENQVRGYAFAEGGTQIERGVEHAVTLAVKAAEEARREGSDLFVHFVLMTDGQNEGGYKKQAFGNVMDIERQRLRIMSNLSSYLSAVNIGMYADTECAMYAHQALTNTSATTDPLSRAETSRDISNVVKKLSEDSARFSNSRNVEIKLQLVSEDLLYKVGFMSNPGSVPSKTFRAVGNASIAACLFEGDPEKDIKGVEGYASHEISTDTAAAYQMLLTSMPDMLRDLRIAQVAKNAMTNVPRGVQIAETIIANMLRFSSSLAGIQQAKTARARVKMMNQGINSLREQLSDIKTSNAISNASSAQQASYIVGLDKMKYGKSIAKRAGIDSTSEDRVRDIVTTLRTAVSSKARFQVNHDLPTSFISQLSARELYNQIPEELNEIVAGSPTEHDLLYAFGMLGHPIRVVRTSAAEIEPWKVKVAYVSLTGQFVGTCDSICALDSGFEIKDLAGAVTPEVLVTFELNDREPYLQFFRTKLHGAYMGVVFARNPSVVIKNQHTALLAMSLSRILVQLGEGERCTRPVAELVLTIIANLQYRTTDSDFWKEMLSKLVDTDDPRIHLTASQDDAIVNIIMPLIALLTAGDTKRAALSVKEKRRKILHAIICQTVANNVSAHNNIAGKSSDGWSESNVLLELATELAIDRDSAPHVQPDDVLEPELAEMQFSSAYDRGSALRHAKKIFSLSFASSAKQILQLWCLFEAFLDELTDDEAFQHCSATMFNVMFTQPEMQEKLINKFQSILESTIARWSHGYADLLTQLELVADECDCEDFVLTTALQAECNPSTSHWRLTPGGTHPLVAIDTPETQQAYIAKTAVDVRKRLYFKDLSIKMDRLRAKAEEEARRLWAEREAQILVNWHKHHQGMPHVFGQEEVWQHNQQHPNDTWHISKGPQMEETGLLDDRCCFPSCPLYLVKLGHDGLWQHLAPGKPIKGLHVACRDAFERRHRLGNKTLVDDVLDTLHWKSSDWSNKYTREEMEQMINTVIRQYEEMEAEKSTSDREGKLAASAAGLCGLVTLEK